MTEIIPAIMPHSLKFAEEQISKVLGLAKKVQIDVTDGKYADAVTWPFTENGLNELNEMARGEKKFPYVGDFILQLDLMILHPIEYIQQFLEMGAKSFVVHIDSTDHLKECIGLIKNSGGEVGLGIKPSGEISVLESLLPDADFVQFMGNDRIGHSGVDLNESVLEKIKEFHSRHPSVPIQIDIGVDKNTIPELKSAGVSSFVSGSAIFTSSNIEEAIRQLQNY